ncbi:hypothetical protein C1646_742509 [Rhizophagus diaphanus]|nr:hypothetical protein C1646_742509 [Rhizophagus diaphanus] [Rhizophagus sp. MUCL 43196]
MANLFCFFSRKKKESKNNKKSFKSLFRRKRKNKTILEKSEPQSVINLKIIPPNVLQLIFSHLDNMGSKGLYSCLFVDHYWHSNVLPILWKNPFTSKPLSKINSVKLIETLLLCLDPAAKQSLRASLKQQKLKLIITNKSSSFDYASLLIEIDYKELEKSIHFYLLESFNNNNNNNNRFISPRSTTVDPLLEHVHLLSKNLFMLFMKKSSKIESLIINKFGEFSDLPIIEIQQQRKSNILSRITKLHLNYYESSDIFDFLRLLPSLCNDLIEFNINIIDFENEALIHRSIADVIISQRGLKKFSIEGARNGGNTILSALGDSQSKTLISIRFKLINFKSTGMKSLTKCDQLKELLFENCQGLTPEITKILFNAKLKNLKKLVIWNKYKAPPITSMIIKSTKNSNLKDLTLDTIIIGTVNTILENCSNITSLKIFDYQPKHNVQMFRLLRDLPLLENLTIYRETEVELGVIDFSEITHLKVIHDWVKSKRTLKFFGIGGKSEFSKNELLELKVLQDEYEVFIIPSHRNQNEDVIVRLGSLSDIKNFYYSRKQKELFKDLKAKEANSKPTCFKQFFEINNGQEIFNDIGNFGHLNEITSEKPNKLREFSSEINSTTEFSSTLPTLPTECLEKIFKNLDNGLFSCLLVCRSWCRNIIPILWSKPFDKLSKYSKYKLIRTYITCLSDEEKSCLNSQLLKYGIKIPYTTHSLFNYSIYLKELSYIELYQSVDSGIKHYRKSFIGYNTYKITSLLTKSICRMFLTKNITDTSLNLQSFKIDRHFIDIFPELDLFSKVYPGLSQITKFTLNYDPNSENLFKFLQHFPNLCIGLNFLDITLPYFENDPTIIDLLNSLIKKQKSLRDFNLSGARIGANIIIPVLLSSHYNNLISIKFQNLDFQNVDLSKLTSCRKLENFTIYHCTGLNRSSLPLPNNFNNRIILKSLIIGCSPKYPQIPTIIIESPLGISCQELCLDLITPEIVDAIKRNCRNVTKLKLRDHFISINKNEPFTPEFLINNLFHSLLLERLTINISPKNSDYEELNIHGRDLPSSCWYLKLQCGFSVRHLYDLLLSDECMASISVLIVDYSKLHTAHLMVIRDLVKEKGTLKYFGIYGKKEFDKEELEVIKDLQYKYKVNVNFEDIV